VKIADIFRSPIDRRIEEVIKVDLGGEEIVASEIDEYVVTDHIASQFEGLLDRYQETILKPDEGTNIWVSGFFGSGKSSFAKIFGYILANPTLAGHSATERFMARIDAPKIQALLNTIHAQAPTQVVFVDLATSKNVMQEGESVVRPLYRALLQDLGYSRNEVLAELEYTLETDKRLDAFVAAFAKVPGVPEPWEKRRNVLLAKNEASRALHLLQPEVYSQPDSWARSAPTVDVSANWFAERAVELLKRRGGPAQRLVFIVDEVGQYVARSETRMLDLQGLAESVSKQRGRLWLLVTSQEKLDDVVESLENARVEHARVQARFPARVDLVPADIDEVAGKRVLQKSDAGQRAVRGALTPHRHKLANHVRLESPTRGADLGEDEFIRLYPLLPYQVQLLIDAVSARRGSAAPMMGGSNRTLIKLAQQLIIDPRAGCGTDDVGALVTVDRAYDLLESIIPTAWQAEIVHVAERYGDRSLEAAVAKVLALCADVRALPLNATNLAVLLHPAIDAESRRPAVEAALAKLVHDEAVRQGDDGYRLQTPEEKDWDKQRRGIGAKPADLQRLRRQLFRGVLEGLAVSASGRSFKVAVTVEGERVLEGDLALEIDESAPVLWNDFRTRSRETPTTVWWAYQETQETSEVLEELHRSQRMISTREGTKLSPTDLELLGQERSRQQRLERQALLATQKDALIGQFIFQGAADDVAGNDLKAVAQEAVRSHVEDIYPRLAKFSAPVTKNDVRSILQAPSLKGLPNYLGADNGIGIVRLTPIGAELATDVEPLSTLIGLIRERAGYGSEPTGAWLLEHFSRPPYGATIEVVQALAAASIRAGLVEAISAGARLRRADDPRLERVFGAIPTFRSTSFAPQQDEVGIELRAQMAERLQKLTGERPQLPVEELARALRATFAPDGEACKRVSAAFGAFGLDLPPAVARMNEVVGRLLAEDDRDAVRTASQSWADLIAGREAARSLDEVLRADTPALRQAVEWSRANVGALGDKAGADQQKLRDLLAAGDVIGHLGEIKSLTNRLEKARSTAVATARAELETKLTDAGQKLRTAFGDLGDQVLGEAMRPLEALRTPESETGAEVLQTRLERLPGVLSEVRRALEDLLAAGHLVRVPISDLAPEPIAAKEDLENVLKAIRDRVEAEIGEGKRVKLE
jgi:hypothetical protein